MESETQIEIISQALKATDLIQGNDWLGTGSSYPTDESIQEEIRENAEQFFEALTNLGFTVVPN